MEVQQAHTHFKRLYLYNHLCKRGDPRGLELLFINNLLRAFLSAIITAFANCFFFFPVPIKTGAPKT